MAKKELVWQGPLEMVDGKNIRRTVKLSEASVEDLKRFDIHCSKMLDGDGKITGKKKRLDLAEQLLLKCKCELTVRNLSDKMNITKEELGRTLNDLDLKSTKYNVRIGDVLQDVLYKDADLKLCIESCLDCIGSFVSNYIPFGFIIDLGVQKDSDFGSIEEVMEYLKLPQKCGLSYKYNGLDVIVLSRILKARGKKFGDISTITLEDMCKRVVPSYIYKIQRQIKKWQELKSAINEELYKR